MPHFSHLKKEYAMQTTTTEIEIFDFECYPDVHSHLRQPETTGRWGYVFPFWIEYANEKIPSAKSLPLSELEAHRARVDAIEIHRIDCDFADVCQWAYEKNLIEDYCIETKEGQVTIPGTSEVAWSHEKQDAVETFSGRYLMNFTDFLREFLTEKDLAEFVKHQTGKVKHT
jgi:hypothetical protein